MKDPMQPPSMIVFDKNAFVRKAICHWLQEVAGNKLTIREGRSLHILEMQDDLKKADLILIDYDLLRANMIQKIRDIHKVNPSIKILVMSIEESSVYKSKILKAGANAFLQKFRLEELFEYLELQVEVIKR